MWRTVLKAVFLGLLIIIGSRGYHIGTLATGTKSASIFLIVLLLTATAVAGTFAIIANLKWWLVPAMIIVEYFTLWGLLDVSSIVIWLYLLVVYVPLFIWWRRQSRA